MPARPAGNLLPDVRKSHHEDFGQPSGPLRLGEEARRAGRPFQESRGLGRPGSRRAFGSGATEHVKGFGHQASDRRRRAPSDPQGDPRQLHRRDAQRGSPVPRGPSDGPGREGPGRGQRLNLRADQATGDEPGKPPDRGHLHPGLPELRVQRRRLRRTGRLRAARDDGGGPFGSARPPGHHQRRPGLEHHQGEPHGDLGDHRHGPGRGAPGPRRHGVAEPQRGGQRSGQRRQRLRG